MSDVTPLRDGGAALSPPGEDGVVHYRITPDEPVLPGHYPGFPIFPGVCLIECAHRAFLASASEPLRLVAVESTRFTGPAFGGDTLSLSTRADDDGTTVRCVAEVGTGRGKAASIRLRYRRNVSARPSALRSVQNTSDGAVPGGPVLDTEGIRALLPHRSPMLLVDEVAELTAGQSLVARKAVSADEPWYAGRSREDAAAAAYPQTLLVESWCQSAGVLATVERPNPDVTSGQVMLFGGISDIEFHGDVFPGEVVEHHVEVSRELSDTVLVSGHSTVAGRTVLTVDRVVMTFRPADVLRPGTRGEGEPT